MLGNVWEWTSSRYGPYPGTTHDSSIYEEDYRVVRGGSWNRPAREARISCRGRYSPETQRAYVGFRVVVDGAAQPAPAEYQPIPDNILMSTPREAATNETLPQKVDRVALHNTLTEHFNLEELRTLCFELHIDYESWPGASKDGVARDLVTYCERHERVVDLVLRIKQLRPNVDL